MQAQSLREIFEKREKALEIRMNTQVEIINKMLQDNHVSPRSYQHKRYHNPHKPQAWTRKMGGSRKKRDPKNPKTNRKRLDEGRRRGKKDKPRHFARREI